jgi:hypothetical protein
MELVKNTCGECFFDSHCPYRMTCSDQNMCTCSTDAQCDGPQPYCFEGRCQACPGLTLDGDGICSTVYTTGTCRLRERTSEVFECVECNSSADCGGAACVDGRCSCVANGCGDGLFCDAGSQKCVGCLEDAHCADPNRPWCDSGKSQCVACKGGDVTCRKEITLGTVACSTYGTCEPMCGEDVRCVYLALVGSLDLHWPTHCLTTSLPHSCTWQGDCLHESRPYCDQSSSRCAACRDDGDCGPSAPFCLSGEVTIDGTTRPAPGRCVQCLTPGSTEYCHLGLTCNSLNFCASCSSDDECPNDRPICSTNTRSCVQCDELAGLSCPKERPICHSGRCLGCESDSDCGYVLHCDPNTNRCELCLTDQVRDLLRASAWPSRRLPGSIPFNARTARPSTASFDLIVRNHVSVTSVAVIRTVLLRYVHIMEKQETEAGSFEVVGPGLVSIFQWRATFLTCGARSIASFPTVTRDPERAFSALPRSPANWAASAATANALTVSIPPSVPSPCRFVTWNLVVALNARHLTTAPWD